MWREVQINMLNFPNVKQYLEKMVQLRGKLLELLVFWERVWSHTCYISKKNKKKVSAYNY